MDIIGNRLREERERLGYNQEQLAAIGGVQKVAQSNYERGVRKPDSAYMQALAANGVDILFVLTGERSRPVAAVDLLPLDERILLDNYRNSPPEARAALKATSAAFAGARTSRKAA